MTATTSCSRCATITDFDPDTCLRCTRFLHYLIDPENPAQWDEQNLGPGLRLTQVIGSSIIGAGLFAAIADLPVVSISFIVFGAGICLADFIQSI
ncbi:hypothetical protein EGT07_00985 [Herbaspirillum sp. HC18]|nr:hypothetical protein EGT07_00985 [Herbaspirillum sp. HC18]